MNHRDANQVNMTESGFTAFTLEDNVSEVNGITIDLAGNLLDANRLDPNDGPQGPGFPLWNEFIYRDFIFTSPDGTTETTDDLRNVWYDGYQNGTCAEVWLELGTVRSGKSMKYEFWNRTYEPYYSEVDSTPSRLGIDPDWSDARSLSIWFYGDAGNDANEPMYVKLIDETYYNSTVYYDGAKSDIRKEQWQEWVIDLSLFSDVNLSSISQITIGIGDETQAASDGVIYVDDISLCARRCVLAKRSADFTLADYAPVDTPSGDCIIDIKELEIMANDWLAKDIFTKDPGTTNLTAYYSFDIGTEIPGREAPNNIAFKNLAAPSDVCSIAYLSPKDPCDEEEVWLNTSVPGIFVGPYYPNSQCIHFTGYSDYPIIDNGERINCGRSWNPLPGAQRDMTLAIWVKWAGPHLDRERSQGLISKRVDWPNDVCWMFECDTRPGPRGSFALRQGNGSYDVYSPEGILDSFVGQWVHLAATFDEGTTPDGNGFYSGTARLYLNTTEVASGVFAFGQADPCEIDLTIGQNSDRREQGVESFKGDLDEVYIFNRVLGPDEIAYLADTTPWDGYIPLQSPAEIYKEEPIGRRIVNFKDFALVANLWLEEEFWP